MRIPSKDELLYYAQEGLGAVAGRLLGISAKIAARRQDMHEFAHILSALMAGNTTECRYDLHKCSLLEIDEIPISQDELENAMTGEINELDWDQWLGEL